MMSALKTKKRPLGFSSESSFSARRSGPAVPRGSDSSEQVILIPYYNQI